jgi:hypothetical protein
MEIAAWSYDLCSSIVGEQYQLTQYHLSFTSAQPLLAGKYVAVKVKQQWLLQFSSYIAVLQTPLSSD